MESEIKRVEWILFGTPETEGIYTVVGMGNIFIPQEAIETVAQQGPPYFGVEITPEPVGGPLAHQAQWRVTRLVYDAFDPE